MADYGYEWCYVCNRETVWRWSDLPDECTEHDEEDDHG